MSLPLLGLLPSSPPRVALGVFPSPTEEHPRLATALGLERPIIKRDDLNGTPLGGNRLRALEWLLPATGAHRHDWRLRPGVVRRARRFLPAAVRHTFDRRLASPTASVHPLLRDASAHAELLWPHLKSI